MGSPDSSGGEAIPPDLSQRSTERIAHRVANGAGMLWGLQMMLRGLQLVTVMALARLLTPSDFGLVALATTILGVLDVLTNVQVGSAIIRTRDLDQSYLDTAFTLNLLRGLITAVALAASARPLAQYMGEPRLEPILYVLILPTFVSALSNPYFILFNRNLDFRVEVQRRALASVIGSVASIIVAFAFRSYWALIVSTVVQSLFTTLFSYWRLPSRPRLSLRRRHEMFGFGGWMLVQRVLSYVSTRFEVFFMGKFADTKSLGAYQLSLQTTSMATGDLAPILSNALFPAFSIMQDEPERIRRNYLNVQATCLAIALPIGFGMAILAEPLILAMFGPRWSLAVPMMQMMAPVTSIQTMTVGVEVMAMALNRPRALATRSAIYLVVRTILILAGFHYAGVLGIVAGRSIAGLFHTLYGLALGKTLTGGRLRDPFIASWRSFAAIAVMTAVLLAIPSPQWRALPFHDLLFSIGWRVALGALVYCGTHGLLWVAGGRKDGAERVFLNQMERFSRRR